MEANKNFVPIAIYCCGLMFFVFMNFLSGINSEPLNDFIYSAAWFGIPHLSLATIMFVWCFGGLIFLIAYQVKRG